MENQISLRNLKGLDDFLLLENYDDENAFIENLRKRFNEKIIYVSLNNSYYNLLINLIIIF